jgi:hypothetical protein
MRFENQQFRTQDVELDFNHFVACRFEHCNLIIRGLSPLAIQDCHFDACNFHFDGPAAMTLGCLQVLYKSMPQVAELAFQVIRGEVAVPKPH